MFHVGHSARIRLAWLLFGMLLSLAVAYLLSKPDVGLVSASGRDVVVTTDFPTATATPAPGDLVWTTKASMPTARYDLNSPAAFMPPRFLVEEWVAQVAVRPLLAWQPFG